MGIKSLFVRPYANYIAGKIKKWSETPIESQESILRELVHKAGNTAFGVDHKFNEVQNYEDFKQRVPIRDYEELRPYVDRVVKGEADILWPGRPAYFAKTSGTTSGVKYIPLTIDSLPNHFESARNATFNFAAQTGDYRFLNGKIIFLSGSPEMDETNGIPTGRLSGIVNHQVPAWLKGNQKPSYKTNCIDDWEEKVEKIVDETIDANMTLISGIPPWVQMYYEKLLKRSGKKSILELFPNLCLFVFGGVNMEPYRSRLEQLTGGRVNSLELYPASEGFIAFQDRPSHEGLLLNTHSGIFFEFIPAAEFFNENPTRISLKDVAVGVDYVIIINNNAGLWGYNIGDTVEFLTVKPYRLRVTGRIKHYISAFGEHVIGKEVDDSLMAAAREQNLEVVEFTVAPEVNPESGLPYHEWFIEFEKQPESLDQFESRLDELMREQNIYYDDLISGKILRPLKITPLKKGAFIGYMKSQGKLGGQNKVPRLANDRKIADELSDYRLS
jgi:hypothetical protein